MPESAHQHQTGHTSPAKSPWRFAGKAAVLVVMGLAFAGYLSPEMRLQWANLASLCGF